MAKKLICMVLAGLGLAVSCPATAGIIVAEKLLVDLRADDLPLGPATQWRNHGTLGNFTAQGSPMVENVNGRKAVTFNGQSCFVGPASVPGIEGAGTRSIEVWALNPTIAAEETMVSWAHRGGPNGTNMAFNYGNNTSYGAVGHWSTPDMAWAGSHAPAPAAGVWWHLVYTFDGTTARLYVNGVQETSKAVSLNTYGGTPIRIAAQADDTGAAAATGYRFTGSIAAVRIHDGVLSAADVANNFGSKPSDQLAGSPKPGTEAKDIPRDVPLNWAAGQFAKTHDVYLGTTPADVNNASRTNTLGVLASRNQDANNYDPPGVLEFGKTYYWRIDEVNGAPDNTIFKGDIWSFTVEPVSYPITGVTATASSSTTGMGPEKTVNGSGLNTNGEHSNTPTDMWLSAKGGAQPTWIQYAFDKAYKLDKLLVWNSNQMLESALGFGAKTVVVEHSLDAITWTALGESELAQASGDAAYTANTTVNLGGVVAKHVRLTIKSNWGGLLPQYGLSEVRFFYIPTWAREPKPAAAATAVDPQVTLSWRAGREAASHKLYVSPDKDAVTAGTASAMTVSSPSHQAAVELAQTYYWKVVEVNNAKTPSSWESDVWSFTTVGFLTVDDFEGYTDNTGSEIFAAWVDGFTSGSSGSQVGNLQAPFAEPTVVHGGRQAMPLFYDNSKAPRLSEAERTFKIPQDWSQYGITTLVLYFRGNPANDPAPLYVKINDKKVLFSAGAPVTALPVWKQWNIDLASVGTNLKSVKTLTIGVGDGAGSGKGVLYVDDILLYRTAPAVVSPVDPGTGGLMAYYMMEGNVQDSSGKNYHGVTSGTIGYEKGASGQAMIFNGTNAYVTLPIGSLLASLSDTTVATWVNWSGTGGSWQRIFDFGSGTTSYMFLTPRTNTNVIRFAIRTPTVTERIVNAPMMLPAGWHHVAVVLDSKAMTETVYLDGIPVQTAATTVLPKDMGNTTQNWLGKSQYAADAYFTGSLDEFRIYNRALSAAEIRYLAGDR